jgi:hypothetical protein
LSGAFDLSHYAVSLSLGISYSATDTLFTLPPMFLAVPPIRFSSMAHPLPATDQQTIGFLRAVSLCCFERHLKTPREKRPTFRERSVHFTEIVKIASLQQRAEDRAAQRTPPQQETVAPPRNKKGPRRHSARRPSLVRSVSHAA